MSLRPREIEAFSRSVALDTQNSFWLDLDWSHCQSLLAGVTLDLLPQDARLVADCAAITLAYHGEEANGAYDDGYAADASFLHLAGGGLIHRRGLLRRRQVLGLAPRAIVEALSVIGPYSFHEATCALQAHIERAIIIREPSERDQILQLVNVIRKSIGSVRVVPVLGPISPQR
jgi:hypothetical protein